MLDTSDKAVFQSSYDPSMGTSVKVVVVDDSPTPVVTFNEKRRTLILHNAGINTRITQSSSVYICFNSEISPGLYTTTIHSGGIFAVDNYGGLVTALCDVGETTTLCVTEMQ